VGLILDHWSVGPIGYVIIALGVLYEVGHVRRQRATHDRSAPEFRDRRIRAVAFLSGLAALFVAFESPIDYWSDWLFWVHMIQHLLILVVASPLIVVGAPWLLLLRGLPARVGPYDGWPGRAGGWSVRPRRTVGRLAARVAAFGPLRALGRAVNRPVVAWLLAVVDVWVWHMPGPYDATLRSLPIHYAEHASFLLFGILFWLQVYDSYPLRSKLSPVGRLTFLAAWAAQNWILSMALAFASGPWYAGYADLAHRPEAISALQDQTIGAGIMWIPGMLPVALAVVLTAYRWLHPKQPVDLDTELAQLVADEERRRHSGRSLLGKVRLSPGRKQQWN